jgi:hypothetical protein
MADDSEPAPVESEHLTEGAKEALKEELKDFLRELTKFTLWVSALTFVVLSSRNSVQMHNAAVFLRDFFDLAEDAAGAPPPSADGFWQFIIGATAKINQPDEIAQESPSSTYVKLGGTTVFGSRLRQIRVRGDSCASFYDAVQEAAAVTVEIPCFGSGGLLSTSTSYKKEWRDTFM